jgi:thiol-disulfide isomerase/thioredoxin
MARNTMFRTNRIIYRILLVVVMLGCFNAYAANAADHPILYLFWGEGCPHCEAEKAFLTEMQADYPQLEMRWFEVWDHPEFAQLANALGKAYNIKATSVPLTFLGSWGNIGFLSSEITGVEISNQLKTCLSQGCPDALDKLGPQQIVTRIRDEAANKTAQGWELYPSASATTPATTEQAQPAQKIVVYYFHTTYRCQSCTTIEMYTDEAIKEAFAVELKSGVLAWQPVNVEKPETQHFIQDYKLYTKSVIVSEVVDGKEQRWKNLAKVWELLQNEKTFKDYVKQEIAAYLKEQDS